MRIGVVTFPGTLDDRDAARAVRLAGGEPVALWHADADLRAFSKAWNAGGASLPPLPAIAPWRSRCQTWRDALLVQPDLTSQLIGFAAETR